MSSREISEWNALFLLHADERERAKLTHESGDGAVYISGLDELPVDDDEDDDEEGIEPH